MMIGTNKLMIPYFSNSFALYDETEEITQVKLFGNLYLPICFGHNERKEYLLNEQVYSKEEAKELFENKITKFIQTLEEKGVQIIEKNVTINKTAKVWKMKVDFLTIEKTGTLKKTQLEQIQEPIPEAINEGI